MIDRVKTAAVLALCLAGHAAAQEEKADPKADARRLIEEAKGKRGKAAVELYASAIEKDPSNPDGWVGRARERRHAEPMAALADLARPKAVKEDVTEAQFWRAVVLHDALLDRVGAWDEFQRCSRGSAQVEFAFLGAGAQKMLIGDWVRAEEDFDRAIKANPSAPLAWRFKAQCAYELNNALARDAAQQAVKLWPEDPSVQATGALVTGMENLDLAVSDLDRILAEYPALAWAALCKARVLIRHSKFEAALSALDALSRTVPGSSDVQVQRGHALAGLDRELESEAAFDRAFAWDPNCVAALEGRAALHRKTGRLDALIRDLKLTQKFRDQNENIRISQEITDIEKKRELAAGAIFSAAGHCERAELFAREGNWEGAEKSLADADGVDPKERRIRVTRLRVYAKKKDLEKLKQTVQQAIDDGEAGFSWVYDRSPEGNEWFGELNKDPQFETWARGLELKAPEDLYNRATMYYEIAGTLKGDAARQTGLYRESALEYRTMCDRFPQHSAVAGAYYNEACCWSLIREVDKAFGALDLAIDRGFDQVEHMEKNDTDLANMRSDGRWPAIVRKLKDKVEKPK
ncbi:MAG: tetratricopeptide repeat protein [Candidatus Brocadiae bacterium]|nr:tetratricopeptide repeat protein [Candidatus Brocadiia bacterium]